MFVIAGLSHSIFFFFCIPESPWFLLFLQGEGDEEEGAAGFIYLFFKWKGKETRFVA